VDLGQRLDEIHRDVCPDSVGHRQGLEEAGRLQGLRFVALASGAGADVVTDEEAIMFDVEVGA
jgi:hypothetical protein